MPTVKRRFIRNGKVVITDDSKHDYGSLEDFERGDDLGILYPLVLNPAYESGRGKARR